MTKTADDDRCGPRNRMTKTSKFNASDRRFLLGVIAVLAVVSSLPYLYGYRRQTPELRYLGLHGFAPGDTFVYFSYLWQAQTGDWLFHDWYTTERGFPMLNTFWAAAGGVGRLFRFSVPLTFHLARLAAIAAVVAAVWLLSGVYAEEPRRRRWAVLLAIFGSGISGYLLPLFHPARDLLGYYHLPLDLWVAEFNVFTSALHSGHLVLAFALIPLVFVAVLRGIERRQLRWSVLGGIAGLALLSFHPFHAPLILLTLAVWGAALMGTARRWDVVAHIGIVAAFLAPLLAYYAFALRFDPVSAGRAARNIQLTPAWYLLLPSLGLLLPGAITGVVRLVGRREWREPRWLLLLAWMAVQTVLILLPAIPFQRRLVTGWTLPLVMLTLYGWPSVRGWMQRRPRISALGRYPLAGLAAAVAMFGFSNLVNLANDVGLMHQRHPLVFVPRAETDALVALRSLTDAASVVLAGPASSYLVTGWSGRPVTFGHDVETLDYESKQVAVSRFYQAGTPQQRRGILERLGATHVFAGVREVGNDWSNLEALPFLEEIWRNEAVRIYRVTQ